MSAILTVVTSIMTFVIASLGEVLDVMIENPVLLLPLALGVGGTVIYWARSFFHV